LQRNLYYLGDTRTCSAMVRNAGITIVMNKLGKIKIMTMNVSETNINAMLILGRGMRIAIIRTTKRRKLATIA